MYNIMKLFFHFHFWFCFVVVVLGFFVHAFVRKLVSDCLLDAH